MEKTRKNTHQQAQEAPQTTPQPAPIYFDLASEVRQFPTRAKTLPLQDFVQVAAIASDDIYSALRATLKGNSRALDLLFHLTSLGVSLSKTQEELTAEDIEELYSGIALVWGKGKNDK